jgi:hypothetical protein
LNEDRQQPLRIEALDTKRQNHWDFARPAARGRDRREMRGCPTEVSTRHSAPQFPLRPYTTRDSPRQFPLPPYNRGYCPANLISDGAHEAW